MSLGRPDILGTTAVPTTEPRRVRVVRTTKRLTMDLPLDEHAALRQWAAAADVPASYLIRELLALAGEDDAVRSRVQTAAVAAQDRRYATHHRIIEP